MNPSAWSPGLDDRARGALSSTSEEESGAVFMVKTWDGSQHTVTGSRHARFASRLDQRG